MDHVGIAHLHMCYHCLGKGQKKNSPCEYCQTSPHLQRLHHIKIRKQHQHISRNISKHTDQMPAVHKRKKRCHHQLGIQNAKFRGVIPVRSSEYMSFFRQQPGKNHFRGHIGVQPLILPKGIQKNQGKKNQP